MQIAPAIAGAISRAERMLNRLNAPAVAGAPEASLSAAKRVSPVGRLA